MFRRNREALIPPSQRTQFDEETANPPETYDQMLIRLAHAATDPKEIKPLIKQAKSNKGGPWKDTVKTLKSIQRDLKTRQEHIRSGWTRAKVNLDSGYESPTVERQAHTVGVKNKWGEVVSAKPYPAARAAGKETMAVKDDFGEWVEVTVSSQGGRGAKSTCTSGEWGSPPDLRDRSIHYDQ